MYAFGSAAICNAPHCDKLKYNAHTVFGTMCYDGKMTSPASSKPTKLCYKRITGLSTMNWK